MVRPGPDAASGHIPAVTARTHLVPARGIGTPMALTNDDPGKSNTPLARGTFAQRRQDSNPRPSGYEANATAEGRREVRNGYISPYSALLVTPQRQLPISQICRHFVSWRVVARTPIFVLESLVMKGSAVRVRPPAWIETPALRGFRRSRTGRG